MGLLDASEAVTKIKIQSAKNYNQIDFNWVKQISDFSSAMGIN